MTSPMLAIRWRLEDLKQHWRDALTWARGIDTAPDLSRVGHRAMQTAPHRPSAASRGASDRWDIAHPFNRWERMGNYRRPRVWLEDMLTDEGQEFL